jgi:hypothetical protein
MSATPDQVEQFWRSGTSLASKITGGVAGAVFGAVIAGPAGAIVGAALAPFLEHQLTTIAGEFITRGLGDRQKARAGAGAVLLTTAVQSHLDAGASLRGDDFLEPDDTGRSAMNELAEQAILAMVNSVEERRLPYLAKLYASVYFDEAISRSSIATLVSLADTLNFRAMCILNIVGRRVVYTGAGRDEGPSTPWPVTDHMVAKEVFGLIGESVVVSKLEREDHNLAVLEYLEVEPGRLQLGALGQLMFDKMDLASMPLSLPDLIDTEESLRRIAMSASNSSAIDGGTFEERLSPATFEKQFDENDWTLFGDKNVLTIPPDEHRRGRTPMVQVHGIRESGGYEEVMADNWTLPDGTVELSTNRTFTGRVLIQ